MREPAASCLPPKLFYRIGEVAELVGVETHVLRYWEREFRTIRPTKSAKGQRVYSRRDVEKLIRVRRLLYAEGFTIAGAKKKLEEAGPEREAEGPPPALAESTNDDVQAPLASRTRDQLLAMRAEVEAFLAELAEESPPGPETK
jgi:DNA-binding transcriptional MerR regulator